MSSNDQLPPGTERLDDSLSVQLLAPQPNSDPNQPLNWSPRRKVVHMALLCLYGLMVFTILCISQPLWQVFNEELGISYAIMNDGYAANTATLAIGCIFLVPVALRFGRRPIYIATAIFLLGIAIWQACFHTGGEMIAFSTLCGLAGAVNEALFQVTVSDLFFVHQRGTMNGIFLAMVVIGTYLSPVVGGYIANDQDWRWIFWYCTIIMGVTIILMLFFFEETKYTSNVLEGVQIQIPSNLDERITKIDSHTKLPKDEDSHGAREGSILVVGSRGRLVELDTSIPMRTYWQRHWLWANEPNGSPSTRTVWSNLYLPFLTLIQFPAIIYTALQYGFAMAMLSIVTITQTTLYPYPPYNFSTIGVGNMNVPPAIGAILGSVFGGPLVDWTITKIAKRRGGIYEPETRLWLIMIPSCAITGGLFMFGLTITKGMAWPINAVGAGILGFGVGGVGDISLTYCQDSYQGILGDALTGVTFVRNIIVTIIVFVITPWATNMGFYNVFLMLGCISILFILMSIPMIMYGRSFRVKYAKKYKRIIAKQY